MAGPLSQNESKTKFSHRLFRFHRVFSLRMTVAKLNQFESESYRGERNHNENSRWRLNVLIKQFIYMQRRKAERVLSTPGKNLPPLRNQQSSGAMDV